MFQLNWRLNKTELRFHHQSQEKTKKPALKLVMPLQFEDGAEQMEAQVALREPRLCCSLTPLLPYLLP
jgi:hypothetical protein